MCRRDYKYEIKCKLIAQTYDWATVAVEDSMDSKPKNYKSILKFYLFTVLVMSQHKSYVAQVPMKIKICHILLQNLTRLNSFSWRLLNVLIPLVITARQKLQEMHSYCRIRFQECECCDKENRELLADILKSILDNSSDWESEIVVSHEYLSFLYKFETTFYKCSSKIYTYTDILFNILQTNIWIFYILLKHLWDETVDSTWMKQI